MSKILNLVLAFLSGAMCGVYAFKWAILRENDWFMLVLGLLLWAGVLVNP